MTIFTISGQYDDYTPDNFISTPTDPKNISFNPVENSIIVICSSNDRGVPDYIWIEYRESFTKENFLNLKLKVHPVGFYVIRRNRESGEKIVMDIKQHNPHFSGL